MQKKILRLHFYFILVLGNASLIISAQNVGIGVTTPSAPLHLKSPTLSEMLRVEGNNPYISFFNASLYKGYVWYDGTRDQRDL